ncbi:hypothetical protein CPB86DRAFT_830215 [Serendipita vermifera]|nr:hypothetical protein CPB86DRAFT_830215 [Serendipita vermifera]
MNRSSLWEQGSDEPVEVNQRALIDKVLARYSGKHSVFREVLQNADDAGATHVQIRFQTADYVERGMNTPVDLPVDYTSLSADMPSSPDLQRTNELVNQNPQRRQEDHDTSDLIVPCLPPPALENCMVVHWTIKNNGRVFREEDWARLKKIADGNPDEEKIGAFGVGFYTLFSVTDMPIVESGDKWMGFYWKDGKDQLFARRGTLETPVYPWTTFQIPLQKASLLEDEPSELLRFFTSSLPFMRTLSRVELFLNDSLLGQVQKNAEHPIDVSVPPSLVSSRPLATGQMERVETFKNNNIVGQDTQCNWCTPENHMMVYRITSTIIHLHVEAAHSLRLSQSNETDHLSGPLSAETTDMQRQEELITESPYSNALENPHYKRAKSHQIHAKSDTAPSETPSNRPSICERREDAHETENRSKGSLSLAIFTAEVSVNLDERMEASMECAMKKKPPMSIKVQLTYTQGSQPKNNEKDTWGSNNAVTMFSDLVPNIRDGHHSKIYIGHATGQTTGIGGHISSRFIPTVEREAIDLVHHDISTWNKEILQVAGYLCRVIYEIEISNISESLSQFSEMDIDSRACSSFELNKHVQATFMDVLQFFSFHPSTPDAGVSDIMQSSFFSISDDLRILSTCGVEPTSKVRIPDRTHRLFIQSLPLISRDFEDEGIRFIKLLENRKLITKVSYNDVLQEMSHRLFNEDEMLECIHWWLSAARCNSSTKQFLNVGRFTLTGETGRTSDSGLLEMARVIHLANISTYIDPKGPIPPEMRVPSTTLPFKFSNHDHSGIESYAIVFGWSPLTIEDLVTFLSSEQFPEGPEAQEGITNSPAFATRILILVSEQWNKISRKGRDAIKESLTRVTCIPTQIGLTRPTEAYFFSKHIFLDLPMIDIKSISQHSQAAKDSMENFLSFIGVRSRVDVQIMFDRMVNTNMWTIPQLATYLMAEEGGLTSRDRDWLKNEKIFLQERRTQMADDALLGGHETFRNTDREKHRLNALYQPTEELRLLELPLLEWPDMVWADASKEAKLLVSLGLKIFPPLPKLLELAGGATESVREAAFTYLLKHMQSNYANDHLEDHKDIKFIPAIRDDLSPFLAGYDEVFLEPSCTVLGFAVPREDIRKQVFASLGIEKYPSPDDVIKSLFDVVIQSEKKAELLFSFLGEIANQFTEENWGQLGDTSFIPFKPEGSQTYIKVKPHECYLKQHCQNHPYVQLFHLVDFGIGANQFLERCGVRREPSLNDVVKKLVHSPQDFYEKIGQWKEYMDLLKTLSTRLKEVTAVLRIQMKDSPFIPCSRVASLVNVLPEPTANMVHECTEKKPIPISYSLKKPREVVIMDIADYARYEDMISAVPRDCSIEQLCGELGSPRLSQIISESCKCNGEITSTDYADHIRCLVLTRYRIFLHDNANMKAFVPVLPEWIEDPANFGVKETSSITYSIRLDWEGKSRAHSEEVTAYCRDNGSKKFTLYIVNNASCDLYELARTLCKKLIPGTKQHDFTLLHCLLASNEDSLKKRYDVERILNRSEAGLALIERNWNDFKYQHDAGESRSAQSAREWIKECQPRSQERIVRDHNRRKERRKNLLIWNRGNRPSCPLVPSVRRRRSYEFGIACVDRGDEIDDIPGSDLIQLGIIGDTAIYVAEDVPDGRELLLNRKKGSLNRFVSILAALGRIFCLEKGTLNIFYDPDFPYYSLNINNVLFLNLNFFEIEHDRLVKEGKSQKAIISWYFTVAHLIAENMNYGGIRGLLFGVRKIEESHTFRLFHEIQGLSRTGF